MSDIPYGACVQCGRNFVTCGCHKSDVHVNGELPVEVVSKITEQVQKRKRIRREASEIIELATDWMKSAEGTHNEDEKRVFWETIVAAMPTRFTPQPVIKTARPMNDKDARDFGRIKIQFGMHEGKRYRDVPLHYLLWMDEQSKRLASYLASDYVQREQAE